VNCWQVLRQLKSLLKARQWPGSSNVVFHGGSVLVTSGADLEAIDSCVVPVCLLVPQDGQIDPEFGGEEPNLLQRSIGVTLITDIVGDAAIGENALLGANRTAGNTYSEGRGLLELEEELFSAIKRLHVDSGVSIQLRAASSPAARRVDVGDKSFRITASEYVFEALCTAARSYPAGFGISATLLPGGDYYTLAWKGAPARHDRLRYVLRKATGSTPPASATDGTGVTLSSDLATSVTVEITATTSFALFVAYDETSETPTTPDRYSAALTLTVTI
jgi:hypothetical protein